MKQYMSVFGMLCVMLLALVVKAAPQRENGGQLVITEVCLDSHSQQVWIEVFNPENTTIMLTRLWILGVRTPNVLPPEIRRQQGIEIKPGERIILCGDLTAFQGEYGSSVKAIEQALLKHALNGGLVTISRLDETMNMMNTIRLGNIENTSRSSDIVPDDQVVIPVSDGSSYQRTLLQDGEISTWISKSPNPGN